ncbi:MAG: acyl-CoA/acyl-ACP dehydrogenase [Calditrichaeota bacterium]|nr:acyl-CoA/acyl-ACP dehydrogenase [Calditrichota bacterium]
MAVVTSIKTDWIELVHQLGKRFAERAAEHDRMGEFVFENYEELKREKFFSLMIPAELGGEGLTHDEVCDLIRILAHYCGSTALALSMHQHLVAATVWKYIHKNEGEPLLRKIAENQLVLVSTGARDWLGSNGELKKTDGGFLLNGRKNFASQSVAGDLAVTSAPYLNPDGTWQVLHFAVSLNAPGVTLADDWDVMGMRGTGSQAIEFENVFIPDSSIVLARIRDEFHPVWSVVLTVAMPLIMSAYVGIAERALEIAIERGKQYQRNNHHLPYIIAQIHNLLISAQAQLKMMISLAKKLNFSPNEKTTVDILSLKTNVAEACRKTVAESMSAVGGQSFYKLSELERLFRDIQASEFHPLPKWDQYEFTGKRLLGNLD